MPNTYINKVVKSNGDTLIDLTSDTVTSSDHIMSGYVGHLASGAQVTGTGVGGVQSDWAQNDATANDYVKNRVCYTGDPVMTVITTGTMPAGNSYIDYYGDSLVRTDAFELLSIDDYPDLGGLEYSVVYGETTYTGTIYSEEYDGEYYNIIGNPYIFDESYPDNGQPFAFDFNGFGVKDDAVSETDTTLSISVSMSPVYKLDDKYLNGSLIKRGTGQHSVILNGEKNGLIASGDYAVAEGNFNTASGIGSHAEGDSTKAEGAVSHSEGQTTEALGDFSHTEGSYTVASGYCSHAEGNSTTAFGDYSHSEGQGSEASGSRCHAEGWMNISSGDQSHSEGYYNIASGRGSHAEGGADTGLISISITGEANALTYTTNSKVASLVGFRIGLYNPTATIVSETRSGDTITSITVDKTLSGSAVSNSSRTIYGGNVASGLNSHAEGVWTLSQGDFSHVEGYQTIASHRSQHVFGEYNVKDPSIATAKVPGTYVEIVGNGTYNAHSNARTLDWSGNEVLAGKLTVGAAPTANMDVATKKYVDDAVAGSGSAVTYTLSISNNVITLTGSDGSTSSATLPVYAGGVSS